MEGNKMENCVLSELTEHIKIGNTNLTVVNTYGGSKTILEIFERMIDEFISKGWELQK